MQCLLLLRKASRGTSCCVLLTEMLSHFWFQWKGGEINMPLYMYIIYMYKNWNMCRVTSTPPISIGHSPTQKLHLQSRGLSPVTLSNIQRLHSQHQLNMKRSHLSGFQACLPSSGWHTDKYLTNDDHIRRLNIRHISWVLWWASPRIMSHTVKPHNPQRITVRLPPRQLFPLNSYRECRTMSNGDWGSARHTPHVSIFPPITSSAFWLNDFY